MNEPITQPQTKSAGNTGILKFAVDWMKDRRAAIYARFKAPELIPPAEISELITELAEIEKELGDES
jgi:hypothetical protein